MMAIIILFTTMIIDYDGSDGDDEFQGQRRGRHKLPKPKIRAMVKFELP